MHESLLDPNGLVLQLFPPTAIENLIQMHLAGSRDQSARLWRLLMLGRWFESFGRRPESVSGATLSGDVGAE
jgi:hypothetical protein